MAETATATNDHTPNGTVPEQALPGAPSVRHVIEHALIDYGFSPDVASALINNLLAEGGSR